MKLGLFLVNKYPGVVQPGGQLSHWTPFLRPWYSPGLAAYTNLSPNISLVYFENSSSHDRIVWFSKNLSIWDLSKFRALGKLVRWDLCPPEFERVQLCAPPKVGHRYKFNVTVPRWLLCTLAPTLMPAMIMFLITVHRYYRFLPSSVSN